MPLVVDQEKTTAYLEEHEGELNRDAVDYGLTRENGEFKIIEGQDGNRGRCGKICGYH